MTDPPVFSPASPSAPELGWADRLSEALPSWSFGRLVAVALGALAAAVVLGFLVVRPGDPPAPLVLPPPDARPSDAVAGPPSSPGSGERSAVTPAGPLTVHAAGAVAHPGVYGVRDGARVADVVAAAGGAAAEADPDQLNLAAPVADGERVWVPRRGEVAAGGAASAGPNPRAGPATGDRAAPTAVDLNRASPEELEALPGVGPATAAAIVAWRQDHGRFRTVGDLLEVRGIGPAKFEALRPLVRV